jgi:hypothetical protein
MRDAANDLIRAEVSRRTGWFRPFCLAILVLLLVNTCVVGGAIVLVTRQIVTIPPGLISALTGNPSPVTITSTTVLDRIQALSNLMTTKYNYSSLITSEREMPGALKGLYGDKLLMVAVGHVTAGIDIQKIQITEVKRGVFTITLPSPMLLDCFLDEKASYVVSRDTGFFAKPAPNLDQEARRFAVAEFRTRAVESDIYGEVTSRAKTLIEGLVLELGSKNSTVVTSPPDPNSPLPATCQ